MASEHIARHTILMTGAFLCYQSERGNKKFRETKITALASDQSDDGGISQATSFSSTIKDAGLSENMPALMQDQSKILVS